MGLRSRSRALVPLSLLSLATWSSFSFSFGPAAPPAEAPAEDAGSEEMPVLLGREAWQFHNWRAETDDIRGGSSMASLKGLADASGQAEFAGVLSEVDNAFAGAENLGEAGPTRGINI
eukprot:Skav222476  [mRNA]  locus=scaffold242:191239:191592:+ [translate_table: standard]